jgi:hypothetical protein
MDSWGKRAGLGAILLIAMIGLLSPASAWAVTVCPSGGSSNWTNPAGGDWAIPGNWSNGVPGGGCAASITLAGTYTVFTTGSAGADSLTVGGASGTQTLQLLGTVSAGAPVDSLFGVGPGSLTVTTHGVLQLTSQGSNAGGVTLTGGTIINSGLVRTDPGASGSSVNRDIQDNVVNNAGGVIALHADTNTCGCGNTHTWTNNGTISTDPGTISTFTGTAAGVLFFQPTSTGTFINNGHAEIGGAFTNGAGTTSGNPIELCGDVSTPGPGAASFEFDDLPNINCGGGGGSITGDIGANASVLIHNTSTTNALMVTATTDIVNHGVLTMDGGAGTAQDQLLGSSRTLTNAGTLNLSQGASGQIQMILTNTGTVNLTAGTTIDLAKTFTQSAGSFIAAGTLHANNPVNLTGGTIATTGTFLADGGEVTHTGGGTTGSPITLCGVGLTAPGPGTASFQFVSNSSCNNGSIDSDIGAGDSVDIHAGSPGLDIFLGIVVNHGSLTIGGGPGQDQLHGGGAGTTLTNNGTLDFSGSPISTHMAIPLVNNGSINVATGATADFPGPVTLAGGSVGIAGGFYPSAGASQSGGTTTVTGTLGFSPGNALDLTGGTLQGTGTISGAVVNTSGTVHPGNSPGILSITGDYTQAAAGVLAVDVAGSSPGTGYSRLAVGGNAILAGALRVSTPAPQTGTFRVLTAATRTGTFGSVSSAGQTFAASYDATGVDLSGAAPPVVTPPANQSPPTISGQAIVGQKLSASTGAWSGQAPLTYSYQWQRCQPGCSNVGGATGSSYTLGSQDAGARLRVIVTATNSGGPATAPSAQIGPVLAQAHPPSLSHLSLTGLAKGRAKLSLVLDAGQNAPLLQKFTLSLPKGLKFTGSSKLLGKHLTVKDSRGHKLKFSAKVKSGVLTITLRSATSSAHLAIAHPAITASRSLAKRVKQRKVKTLSVTATATDTSHRATRLVGKTKPT